jgi:hypothetical protein
LVGELAAKAQKANGGDFTEAKARIFRLEVDNQLAHLRRETMPRFGGGRTLFVKQGAHPLLLKEGSLVVQGPFAGSGFFGPFGCGLAKKYDGAQSLVDLLFGPKRILLDVLPVVGMLSARALARRHDDHLFAVFPPSLLVCRFVQTRVTPSTLEARK